MNTKGIELSVNFLVGFVLAIVLFGLGVSLLYTIFNQSTSLHEITQDQINSQITALLCSAKEKVCIAGNRVPHERDTLAIYGVYIYNIYDTQGNFTVRVEPGIAVDQNENFINNTLDLITRTESKRIPPNSQDDLGIGVFIPRNALAGTYVFDVYIIPTIQNAQMEKRKIYVNVE
jgi:hypothetical protein